jgi:hypothetical protein
MVQRSHSTTIFHPLVSWSWSVAHNGPVIFGWDHKECILCGTHTATHAHLFFECPTSQIVWQTVNARANIYWPCCTWPNLLQWGAIQYCRKDDIQHLIARFLLSATVYILWHERNKRVFNNQHQSAPSIAEKVFQQVRTQVTTLEFSGNIPTAIRNI